jgi:hypothetical protein
MAEFAAKRRMPNARLNPVVLPMIRKAIGTSLATVFGIQPI